MIALSSILPSSPPPSEQEEQTELSLDLREMYFAKYKQRVHSQVRGVRDSEKLRACEARGGEPECDPRD